MRGEFDDSLKWPFRGTISFRLIDQFHEEDHVERTLTYNDRTDSRVGTRVTERDMAKLCWGIDLIEHSELEPNYLLDNTLVFQIHKCSIV